MAEFTNKTIVGLELIVLDEKGLPVANPVLRAIPVFKALFTKNKRLSGRHFYNDKDRALSEVAYIYYMVDIRSFAVQTFPLESNDLDRHHLVVKSLEFPEDYMPDNLIEKAADWYKQYHNTATVKMLKAGFVAVNVTIDYLEHVDYTKLDSKGRLVYNPKDVMTMLSDIKTQKNILIELTQEVIQDLSTGLRPKGGGSIGLFEKPDKELIEEYAPIPASI